MGAILGPGFGLLGNSGADHGYISEAAATWQWSNFLEAQAAPGQVVVHINLDETCVKLCPSVPRGAVAIDGGSTKKEALEQEQKASLHARRSAMTFVCSVCDDAIVQRALPQVIIGNEKILPLSAANILNKKDTDNILVLRQKSSWVNQDTMVQIIKLLGACLMAFKETHFFILSMDACPCHCTSKVAKACAKEGLRLLYVPASMTSVMQPCDTHVFAQFKKFISGQLELKRLASSTGEVSIVQIVETICEGASTVVQGKSWLRAFAHAGLRDHQRNLSRRFLRKLQWSEAPVIARDLPSLQQLQQVFRAGAFIPIVDVFRLCLARDVHEDSATHSQPENPWRGRLRSSSSLKLECPEGTRRCLAQDRTIASTPASSSRDPCPATITAPSAPRRVPQARRLFAAWLPAPPSHPVNEQRVPKYPLGAD